MDSVPGPSHFQYGLHSRKQEEYAVIPVDYFAYHRKRSDPEFPWSTTFDYQRSSSSSSSGSGRHLVRTHGGPNHSPKLAPLRIHPASFYGKLERHRWERERRIANGRGRRNDERRLSRHHESNWHSRAPRRTDGYHDNHGGYHDNPHFYLSPPTPPAPVAASAHEVPKFYIGPPSSPESARGFDFPHKRSNLSLNSSTLSSPYFAHPLTSTLFLQQLEPSLISPFQKDRDHSDRSWRLQRLSGFCPHNATQGGSFCSKCHLNRKEDNDDASTCSSENPPPTFTLEKYQTSRPKKSSRCSCSAVFIATTTFSTLVLLLIAAFILYIEMVLKHKEYIPDPM